MINRKKTAIKTVIPGEEINVVGFYINKDNNIRDNLKGERLYQHLNLVKLER